MTQVRVEIVERDDRRVIGAASPWFPGASDMAKAVGGGKWWPERKLWTYDLSMETCRSLRSIYTDMLVIGPNLAKWAWSEKDRSERAATLAAATDATLLREEAAPRLYAALGSRTYQRVGARFIADYRSVLLADEPGLGKTIQYLGGVAEAGLDHGYHLIVAPKSSLHSTWAREIHQWTDWHAFSMPEGRAKRERTLELFLSDEYEGPKFLVVNFKMLSIKYQNHCHRCQMWVPTKAEAAKGAKMPDEHWIEGHNEQRKIKEQPWPQLTEIKWNSVCIDEAHLSLLGLRGGAKNTQEANGLEKLQTNEGAIRLGSTGTPLRGRALNFFAAFRWLRPEQYTSKWAWAERYLEVERNHFGATIGDVRADREEALTESLRGLMLRRTKKEVQPDLPDDVYQDHWVDMTGDHLRLYQDMEAEGEVEIDGGVLDVRGVLAEYTRRKQIALGTWEQRNGEYLPKPGGSPKVDLLLEMLEKRGVIGSEIFRLEGGWKYVVGSQFTRTLDFVERELNAINCSTLKITGDVSAKRRDRAVSLFQDDDSPSAARVLLINTAAGGTSLTLDGFCDEMFVFDETWVHDDQFQLEGRIRNRSVERRVATRFFHYVRTRGTIEEEIFESGLTQDEFQKKILDGSRGHNAKARRYQ